MRLSSGIFRAVTGIELGQPLQGLTDDLALPLDGRSQQSIVREVGVVLASNECTDRFDGGARIPETGTRITMHR